MRCQFPKSRRAGRAAAEKWAASGASTFRRPATYRALHLGEARETPEIAPDIAVEILSPGDRPAPLEEKIAIYMANGSIAVVVADPMAKAVRVVGSLDSFPGLQFDVGKLFENV